MAVSDYVPRFPEISEFVPQMYGVINETARNTAGIRKNTADTTAQGWKALQDAFNAFSEQNLQGRGLDLKAKELAGTETYRAGDLAQRKEAEFGAEGRAKGARELEYNKMAEESKQAELERRNRLGIARTQAESKEKPDKNLLNKLFIDTVAPSGLINDQGLVPYPKWREYAAMVPEEKALGQFSATLDSNNITDPRLRAQYTQIFKDWYQTGVAPTAPGQSSSGIPTTPKPMQQGTGYIGEPPKAPYGETPIERQRRLEVLAEQLKRMHPLGGMENTRPR